MSGIRSKTSIEARFRDLLSKKIYKLGHRYRINHRKYFGNPDLVFPRHQIVIFVDGCFWHGCKLHYIKPKSNRKYWTNKLKENLGRDYKVTKYYHGIGWNIIRIWEHELKNKIIVNKTIDKIIACINKNATLNAAH